VSGAAQRRRVRCRLSDEKWPRIDTACDARGSVPGEPLSVVATDEHHADGARCPGSSEPRREVS
jgi:hypothetical protein